MKAPNAALDSVPTTRETARSHLSGSNGLDGLGRTRLLLFVLVAVSLSACISGEPMTTDAPPSSRYRLVAYVHGGTPEALAQIGAEKLTHINYAFANVTPSAEVVLEDPEDGARLAALVGLREGNPDLKILLSVGGWSWSENFSDAALTDTSRERFAQSAVAVVRAHDLDGLDLDWEYPGQRGEDNVFRPEDRETFTLLLAAVRAALDAVATQDGRVSPYQLTIAAGANQTYLDHTDMAAAQRHLDFVNLMTYDFHGSWTPRTGHHSNLRPSSATPGTPSASDAVERFVAAGVPPEKIVLGAAFYGRGWTGVTPEDGGLGQPYTGENISLGYGELAERFIEQDGYRRFWDDEAEAPTLWNADERVLITYDDETSIERKAEYVKTQGLGGLMYWQHGHDPAERLLDAAHRVLR